MRLEARRRRRSDRDRFHRCFNLVESSKVYLGDRITVRTLRGWEGNIIGRLPDGRAVLFDKDSPYKHVEA